MLVAVYRTACGAVRDVYAFEHAGGWSVVDVRGCDRRQVERLTDSTDGVEQAVAVANDYAEQARLARRPLVPAPGSVAAEPEREAAAA